MITTKHKFWIAVTTSMVALIEVSDATITIRRQHVD